MERLKYGARLLHKPPNKNSGEGGIHRQQSDLISLKKWEIYSNVLTDTDG
jgi:hypothetical protein